MPKPAPDSYLLLHDNGVYYIHWTERGEPGKRGRGRRQSTGEKEISKATTAHLEWLSLRDGPRPAAFAKALTIGDLWSIYDVKHVQQKVVADDRLYYAWANLRPHFAALTLSQVTGDSVSTYTTKRIAGRLGRKVKPPTVRRELGALLGCIHWCADPARKIIDTASVPHIELPDHGEPADRWLTTHEIKKLFAAATDMRRVDKAQLSRCELFLWLALETAARKEAICQLTWDRVDFETNVIHYDVPGRRKTKKRRAAPPISKALREVLLRARDGRGPINQLVLGNDSDPRRMVMRAAARAGLKGFTPHVLRHTAATHMARKGIPLWIIAKILGNTLAMVERTYAKHAPDDLRQAVDTITGGAVEMG
jgi:integrase